MNEEGEFTFKKIVEQPEPQQGKEGEQTETDPLAGTNVDASQMGQLQEQALMGGKPSPEGGGSNRNKPRMSVGPPDRNTGLPEEAANNNVDRRTETR